MQSITQTISISEKELQSFLREAKPTVLSRSTPFRKPSFGGNRFLSLAAWAIPGILMLASLGFLLNQTRSYFALREIASANGSTPGTYLAVAPAVTPTPSTTPTPTPETTSAPSVQTENMQASIPDNTLNYADFTISAPIHWDVPLAGDTVYTKLETGLTHIEGTAKPSQKGTVAVFGHSSHFPWAKGKFKTVFAPILKAKVGQVIQVNYNGKVYSYKVTKSHVINPDQMSVLNSGDESVLKLITCTPLGTSLRRHVVEAVQISPDATNNAAFTGSQFSGQLPSDR
jgi:LPXTG-site transpeptidase (sortase) family protein